jgi:hypothetical protein
MYVHGARLSIEPTSAKSGSGRKWRDVGRWPGFMGSTFTPQRR